MTDKRAAFAFLLRKMQCFSIDALHPVCHVCVPASNVYRLSRCGYIILHPRLNWVCAIRFCYVGYLWSGISKISCFHRARSSCKSQNLFSRCCLSNISGCRKISRQRIIAWIYTARYAMKALTSHINLIRSRNDNMSLIWKCVQTRCPSHHAISLWDTFAM